MIEKYQDVIDLVAPKLKHKKLNIICADIFDWKPDSGVKYDYIYFDVWPAIMQSNLKDMKVLHNRFKFRLNRDNPLCGMDSWMKHYLKNEKRRDDRERRQSYFFKENRNIENLMSQLDAIDEIE